jgi:hypothetical protein
MKSKLIMDFQKDVFFIQDADGLLIIVNYSCLAIYNHTITLWGNQCFDIFEDGRWK